MTKDVTQSGPMADDDPPPLRIRLEVELLERIKQAAENECISVSEWIRDAISEAPARMKVPKEEVTAVVVRLGRDLEEKAKARADQADATVVAWVRAACKAALDK